MSTTTRYDDCPKCGAPAIQVRYQRNGMQEWLNIRCGRCGYVGTRPVRRPAGSPWPQGPRGWLS